MIDGRIILKSIFKKEDRDVDWIDLALDRDRWRAVVNTVMNCLLPQNAWYVFTSRGNINF